MSEDRFKKVAEKPGLVKDTVTGAILNTDFGALEAYKKQKASIVKTAQRLDKIEQDVLEIKDILKFISERLK